MMHYAGWNLFGNLAAVTMTQGVNILLNLFFGPVVNSARGIAYQVNAAVSGFVGNFQMAMNPQIFKSYAAEDRKYMHQLILQGSKYSFFLLFFIALPLLIETETILKWWLKIVPEYTVLFCRLVLINTLIDCISGPLMTAAQATGKIKKYQAVVGGLLLLILPISYILLKNGYPPEITLYVSISISIIALFTRLFIISPLVQLSILTFIRIVLARVLLVSIVSVIFPLIIKHSVSYELIQYLSLYFHFIIRYSINRELIQFFAVCIVSVPSVIISIYWLGLRNEEQLVVKKKLLQFIIKIKNR
jgi:O-antigen/teichoic acid export membrane protein